MDFKKIPQGMPIMAQQPPKPVVHKVNTVSVIYTNNDLENNYYVDSKDSEDTKKDSVSRKIVTHDLKIIFLVADGVLQVVRKNNRVLKNIPLQRIITFDYHWMIEEEKDKISGVTIVVDS